MTHRALHRIIWVVSALLIVGMSCYFIFQPVSLPTAEAMKPFSTTDKTISLMYPSNWKPNEAQKAGVETGVEFLPKPDTRIVFRTLLQDSLMADIARSGASMPVSLPGMSGGGGPTKTPVETVHEMQFARMERQAANYMHLADKATTKIQIAGVEGLATQFTFKKPVGLTVEVMEGKRICALVGERCLSIVETCPKGAADVMKPIYDKMLASLTIKEPGG